MRRSLVTFFKGNLFSSLDCVEAELSPDRSVTGNLKLKNLLRSADLQTPSVSLPPEGIKPSSCQREANT